MAALAVFLCVSFFSSSLPAFAPALDPSASSPRPDRGPAVPADPAVPIAPPTPAPAAAAADRDRPQEMPQARPAAPAALTFDLRSVPSAAEYRTDAPDGPAFLGSDVEALERSLARINRSLGAALHPDHRLALLARWVYEHLGPDRSLPPQGVFDVLTRRFGLPEPLPHLLVIDAQNVPRLADAVSARLAKVFNLRNYTHIGGMAETAPQSRSTIVVLVLSRRLIRLAPVPRSMIRPGRIKLEGQLEGPFSKPELAHTLPSGETSVTALDPGMRFSRKDFNLSLKLNETGRHRLEIIAQGPDGPDVLANIPVFVGVPVDDSADAAAASADAGLVPEAAGERLFELVNAERSRFGLAPVVRDPRLDAVALGHSEDMRAHGFVAHVSPTTGSTADRLVKAGVVTSLAAENVGRGYSPDEIHRGFMDSPGHRAAILLADVTHLGLGVVTKTEYGRKSFLVTEIFIRRIPPLGPDAKEVLLEVLNRRRASSGARPVREDPQLSEIADQTAREFLSDPSLKPGEMPARLADRLRGGSRRRGERSLYSLVCVAPSLEDAVQQANSDPKTGRFDHVGLGLAQGLRPGWEPNSIVVVLIFFSE